MWPKRRVGKRVGLPPGQFGAALVCPDPNVDELENAGVHSADSDVQMVEARHLSPASVLEDFLLARSLLKIWAIVEIQTFSTNHLCEEHLFDVAGSNE